MRTLCFLSCVARSRLEQLYGIVTCPSHKESLRCRNPRRFVIPILRSTDLPGPGTERRDPVGQALVPLPELILALRRRRGRFGICGTAVSPRRIAYEQKEPAFSFPRRTSIRGSQSCFADPKVRALCILEKQDLCIYDYKEAIDAVREFAEEQPDKFDSAYEMIAAIILVDNEIECKPQYKVGVYQCDFCIP